MRTTKKLSATQAAARLGIHHGTMCRWLLEGRIVGAVRNGKHWEIDRNFRVMLPYTPQVLKRAKPQAKPEPQDAA